MLLKVRPHRTTQCQKPSGWLGRFIVKNMNSRHSKLTDWGLTHIRVRDRDTILDVGCGGGRTVKKLAALATQGKVHGLDHSDVSVAIARKENASAVASGRVEIHEGSVSELPFATDTFDLVTAVETHFWWPDVPVGFREIHRVLKPTGTLLLVAEVYKGANTAIARILTKHISKNGIKLFTPDEHRDLLADAGYSNIEVSDLPDKGWICATAKK